MKQWILVCSSKGQKLNKIVLSSPINHDVELGHNFFFSAEIPRMQNIGMYHFILVILCCCSKLDGLVFDR